ncbi:hypothetical protein [Hymenobacter psychrotolerans]|uniref:SseB protein N-terminal domain-containing protein n=1 Tax=Hymenobacter psychrotolerans DSM 18569 TaxID=1121959 RepID=A0A1M6Z2Q2_9BACT|nr:hypothetical protein [Hymenobacter psychrotolerans]SHL24653.1 hypothetical protein SAMN02746009_02401 [Hymenobacter psychrotolerans DSM 18569]
MDSSAPNDIDLLLQKAKSSGNTEDLSALWKAVLSLPQWHFITRQTANIEDRKPFVGVLDGKPWAFVFTDRQRAQEYARTIPGGEFVDASGNVLVISTETPRAVDYLLALAAQGVHGVRFNELNGWFSPLANLPAIIRHVHKG